ncbi:MAG: DUF3137 domain-containing protein [Ignavibacteriales bacterium]|nr:DUF3137 domain-containing protein [Ignavibacteriales bacterium]
MKNLERMRIPLLFFRSSFFLSIQLLLLLPVCYILLAIFWFDKLDEIMSQIGQSDAFQYVFPYVGIFITALMFPYSFIKMAFDKRVNKLIPKLLKSVSPDFIYGNYWSVNKELLAKSKLFPTSVQNKFNFFYCKNYLTGKVKDVEIKWADIYFHTQSKINRFLWYIPVVSLFILAYHFIKPLFTKQTMESLMSFQGLFMMADFNKRISGTTVIIPDKYEKKFGFLAKAFQKLSSKKGELVYLENPEFEKKFVVYSSDQVEARYILSTKMMETILGLSKKIRNKIMLSFVDNNVFCSIFTIGGFMDLKLGKSFTKGDGLNKAYENLKFCVDIVEDLQLNQRLWK